MLLNRLSPTQYNVKAKYDSNIEGLRGVLALLIAFGHAFGIKNFLDPSYQPNLYFLNISHSVVLVFFILSGYVSSLTNTQAFSKKLLVKYLLKRCVRLMPIYYVSIIVTILVTWGRISWAEVLGNSLFLQNFDSYFSLSISPIHGNTALWYLNYDVLYYLVFIGIWLWKPRSIVVLAVCLFISIYGWYNQGFPQFITGYASGYVFWILGLITAWKLKSIQLRDKTFPFLSYLLLFFATDNFDTGKMILSRLGLARESFSIVNFADIVSILPLSIFLVIIISQRNLKYTKVLELICFAIPISNILILLFMNRLFEIRWLPATIMTVIALILINIKHNVEVLSFVAPLGKISYAFYVIHLPLGYWIQSIFPIEGTPLSFLLRLIVWPTITIMISILLERYMQPMVKKWLETKTSIFART
jgi:peptidoglycan/LPS O-acetylase OafA/YrhL